MRAGERNWDTSAGAAVGDQQEQEPEQVAGKNAQPDHGNNCDSGNTEDAGYSSDSGHGSDGDATVPGAGVSAGLDGSLSLLSVVLDCWSMPHRLGEEMANL